MAFQIPQIIYDFRDCINEKGITACEKHKEGRRNSQEDEDNIKEIIKTKFPERFTITKERNWCDGIIDDVIPVHIKSSKFLASDNACGYPALYSTFINSDMAKVDKIASNPMQPFLDSLSDIVNSDKKIIDNDNYFLIFNKKTNLMIVNSIKNIKVFIPNLTNGLQINWNKNLQFSEETESINVFKNIIKKLKYISEKQEAKFKNQNDIYCSFLQYIEK